MEEAKSSTVVAQQETPTHLLHNQAVPAKCQQSALIQMTTPQSPSSRDSGGRCDGYTQGHERQRQYKHQINKKYEQKESRTEGWQSDGSYHSGNKDIKLDVRMWGEIKGKVKMLFEL